MGRPPTFKDEAEFEDACARYLKQCQEKYHMPQIAGLCVFIGISRTQLYEFAKKYPNTIKAFEAHIEEAWVDRLKDTSPTGAIFYLKNKFRKLYKDRHEQDITSGGKPIPLLANIKNDNNNSDQENNKPEEKN